MSDEASGIPLKLFPEIGEQDPAPTREPAARAPASAEPRPPRLKPVNRKQLLMRTVDVERLIVEDHPARAIWEFVGRLDLTAFYRDIGAVEGVAGRSAWDPRLLISVWVYAYSEGVSSAREVSRLCEYDPACQWLTGLEEINHHTLSDFRVAHKEALDDLFKKVLAARVKHFETPGMGI